MGHNPDNHSTASSIQTFTLKMQAVLCSEKFVVTYRGIVYHPASIFRIDFYSEDGCIILYVPSKCRYPLTRQNDVNPEDQSMFGFVMHFLLKVGTWPIRSKADR